MTTTVMMLADRYRLSAEIGRGGLGVVWEAYDELLQREVAVKELCFPPGLTDDERERLAERTLREAQAVAAIDTACAVRVFDVVEQDGRPWVIMEMVRGRSLTEMLGEQELLPAAEAARIGLFVLEALEAAHRVGVLHRDVKPSNVIVTDEGRVALSDFGIATVDTDPDDGTGVMVGSPLYLAPELAAGEEPTPAADLWGLGATLWTAVQGVPPVLADGEPPTCERCTPEFTEVLAQMMARDPEARPGPIEIREALEAVCRDARAAAVRPLPGAGTFLPESFDRSQVLGRPRETRSWPLAVAILGALVAAALVMSQLLGGGSSGEDVAAKDKAAGAGQASAALPSGWHRYTDRAAGWSIGLPPGWEPTADSASPRFDDPRGGRYVQVLPAYSSSGNNAMAVQRSQASSFAASHSDYALLDMGRVDVAGVRGAADWEFTYVDEGAALHALDRVILAGGHGYAVFFQTHSDQWDASRQLRDEMLASFRAA